MTLAEKFYRKWHSIPEGIKLTKEQWKDVNMMHECLRANNAPKLPFGAMLVKRTALIEHLNNVRRCLKATDAVMLKPENKAFANSQGGKDMAKIWNALNYTFQSIAYFELNVPLERLNPLEMEDLK